MPYGIVRRRSQYCVIKLDTGGPVPGGCHARRSDAVAHLRALVVNVEDAQKKLTKREVEIARLLVAGLTDSEICQALCLATGTVRTHVVNINEKLAINNRSGIFLMMLLRGYLGLGDISLLQKEAVETRKRICIEVS
jgi:DNA-binding CsgD family transcriptional regulator